MSISYAFNLSGMDENEVRSEVFPINSIRGVNFQATFSEVTNVRLIIYVGNSPTTLVESFQSTAPITPTTADHPLIEKVTFGSHCQFGIRPESGATGSYAAACIARV